MLFMLGYKDFPLLESEKVKKLAMVELHLMNVYPIILVMGLIRRTSALMKWLTF